MSEALDITSDELVFAAAVKEMSLNHLAQIEWGFAFLGPMGL